MRENQHMTPNLTRIVVASLPAMGTEQEQQEDKGPASSEGSVRPSIRIRMLRHAESQNNQVYRDARRIYGGGTPHFDLGGWEAYVDEHRSDDPGLSDAGVQQAEKLAEYLVEDLAGTASSPVRIVTSPMRRTLETIRPTLERLKSRNDDKDTDESASTPPSASCIVNAFYFESEGCHVKEEPRPGMNRHQISNMLVPNALDPSNLTFDGFDPNDDEAGWYAHGTGPETRPESEERAAKFYLWLCEYLEEQLAEASHAADVFDAGVDGAPLLRRTVILVGHGDFMALLLKRIIAVGYTHEREGVTHRSAFVHWNTGVTDLEYFGAGRFLLMASNQTPHLPQSLLTGGGLKDGWSYLMPDDKFVLEQEVAVAFSDEVVDSHVREQADALRKLYLEKANVSAKDGEVTLVVKRGLQVVGCASFHEESGRISDVVVRPSARGSQVGRALVDSAVAHAKNVGAEELVAEPQTDEAKAFFSSLGFEEGEQDDNSAKKMIRKT